MELRTDSEPSPEWSEQVNRSGVAADDGQLALCGERVQGNCSGAIYRRNDGRHLCWMHWTAPVKR